MQEIEIERVRRQAIDNLASIKNRQDTDNFRLKYFGKKGELTALLRGLGKMAAEERPTYGQEINRMRNEIEEMLEQKEADVKTGELNKKLADEVIDITLPGRKVRLGHHLHPITQTLSDMYNIFNNMGFAVVDGPEIENDYYNFAALNIVDDHPARDMHDTFYLTENLLLRTHTSSVQVRTMERMLDKEQPLRIISPGKVYRCDYDATHTPMFHQVEGLLIDKNITFADLKGTLESFLKAMFSDEVKVRFRPSFFPFTEPSAEVDVSCVNCNDASCRVCKGSGWLEILGAGMVHPNVLKMSGYDPEQMSGFAFGMGVERIAMLRYGINDCRLFYENDLRFISQF